ncbi:MAG: hypothetical protein CM15mP70_11760 [Pelagibacteraceae bacterium]|nr:MAG: hypothetical protein CM15mP70_11760 [Pelagibacteraceae bacterium]
MSLRVLSDTDRQSKLADDQSKSNPIRWGLQEV